MRTRALTAAVAATLLAAPAAASAHVTLQPKQVPAGGYARMDVRVPNERDDAGTTKVAVQMPDGITSVSHEPVPGWDVEVVKEKVAEPIDAGHGETSDEQVSEVVFTGDGKQGIIEPGQFRDFGLSFRIPDGKPGEKLTFKAVQTYESGEVVRWIGPEDADKPAATVTLVENPSAHGSGGGAHARTTSTTSTSAPAAAAEPSGGGSDTLSIVALVVGALGLLAGAAALVTARRRTAAG